MTRTRHALAASIVATGLLASACTGSSHKAADTSASSLPVTPSTTASSSKPAPPKPAAKNPYTGVGPVPKTATVAVKIDDTAPGRPQVGIDRADIVYIEAVEGGLTRLAAVFGTYKPNKVGYVRSTRPSDPDLLLQFGKITEAYSGGAHDSLPRVHRSGLTSWSNDAGAAYYYRSPHAGDHGYINLALDVAKVAGRVRTTRPKPMGWTFNPSLAGLSVHPGTFLRTRVTGSYPHSSGTPVEFRYYPRLKKYVRFIDGVAQHAADGNLIAATNVVVQECRIVAHPQDTDVMGNPSQFTYTVGKGAVSVFRQGKRIYGTWSRPHTWWGTSLRTLTGTPLPLAPGNTWVVLVRNGQPVQS